MIATLQFILHLYYPTYNTTLHYLGSFCFKDNLLAVDKDED